jgi:oxygen-independent coproporphyrinogen-3 oxidase
MAPETDTTQVGSYFIANYPPFSAWTADAIPEVEKALAHEFSGDTPLGLYLHVPFCRLRCKFCYYKVYTDKNSGDVERYVTALDNEAALHASRPALRDRPLDFVYFGGGTPSYLSRGALESLVEHLRRRFSWDAIQELTFECEPGTLTRAKLEGVRAIGATRLSFGVEHFDDHVLEVNGRAHRSAEIYRAYGWAREVGFDQINVDLIAGMVGETEEKWIRTVEETLKLEPDGVTIYQMELPHNAVFAREARDTGAAPAIAPWETKRRWVAEAFRVFEEAGYEVTSTTTVARPRPGRSSDFLYREALWKGADLLGLGVASFSHLSGVHFQNAGSWEEYLQMVERGVLPLHRAYALSPRERLIREMILQLKLGHIDAGYFRSKFGVNIGNEFASAFSSLVEEGHATIDGDAITLSRDGLLQVDGLLPRFFEPRFRNVRYS